MKHIKPMLEHGFHCFHGDHFLSRIEKERECNAFPFAFRTYILARGSKPLIVKLNPLSLYAYSLLVEALLSLKIQVQRGVEVKVAAIWAEDPQLRSAGLTDQGLSILARLYPPDPCGVLRLGIGTVPAKDPPIDFV